MNKTTKAPVISPQKPSGQLKHLALTRLAPLPRQMRIVFVSGLLLSALLTAQAATHTWTGSGSSGRWSDGANWQEDNPPQSGESAIVLVFPPGASRLNSTNDLAGLAIANLTFSGANYVLYGTNALTLSPNPAESIGAAQGSNRIAAPLILQTNNLFRVETNAALSLAGKLSGLGGFNLDGGGLLTLTPAAVIDNTYAGPTYVLDGTLELDSGRTNDVFGYIYSVALPGAVIVGQTNNDTPAVLRG